jgi:hypothetical protein
MTLPLNAVTRNAFYRKKQGHFVSRSNSAGAD